MDMYWVRQGSPVFVPVTREVWERAARFGCGVVERFICDADTWALERWWDGSLAFCEGGVMANCPYVAMVLKVCGSEMHASPGGR